MSVLSSSSTHSSILHQQFEPLSIPHSILKRIPYQLAIEFAVLPFGIDDRGRLEVLMASPQQPRLLQAVQMHVGGLIKPRPMDKGALVRLIALHYGKHESHSAPSPAKALSPTTPARRLSCNPLDSAVTVVNDIVHEAIRLRASDIHFEPFEREMVVRFRIDGVLQEMVAIPLGRVAEVSSRLKIMARMDIAEKRRSQDGRIRIQEQGRDVDIRVSTLPTDFGEKTVLRLLDKGGLNHNIETIGMDAARLGQFKRAIQMPNGIVLITGPTGSGKSTTLCGMINFLRKPGINISTVEDPIEYNIPGVSQTQVNLATGMSFANSLRTLLRQDPDIIMVGEMRDQETADIAIRASLTGHLVLSTLHTNDAPSAMTRLVDMGIESYLVSSSVTMVVAQRLVRCICEQCKCEDSESDAIKKDLGIALHHPVFKGLGCSHCGYTGYRGRSGIFEVMVVSETIRRLIHEKAYADAIRTQAAREGMVSLRQDALAKLLAGITSVEEVMREIAVLL